MKIAIALLAVGLSCGHAALAQTTPDSSIPGHSGELVTPIVPGPPTYTTDQHQDSASELTRANEVCGPPSSSYLDPKLPTAPKSLQRDALYKGWLAGRFLGRNVRGVDGTQLGEVQDILVGLDGRVTALVVEGGGFLEIGDAAFRIPWDLVEGGSADEGIVARMTRDAAERSGLFDGPEGVEADPREFRISEIRGDWTRIGNETNACFIRRGYVRDVVFTPDGAIAAILETRSARLGGGTYAFPFFSYQEGWRPHYGYYDLPYENMSDPAPKIDVSRFSRQFKNSGKTTGQR